MYMFWSGVSSSTKEGSVYVGFEVLTALAVKSTIFCDITPYSPLKVNRRFGGACRLQLQGRRISRARNLRESSWRANGILSKISKTAPHKKLWAARNVNNWGEQDNFKYFWRFIHLNNYMYKRQMMCGVGLCFLSITWFYVCNKGALSSVRDANDRERVWKCTLNWKKPKARIRRLALLFLEITDRNLGPETGCPDSCVSWLSSVIGIVIKLAIKRNSISKQSKLNLKTNGSCTLLKSLLEKLVCSKMELICLRLFEVGIQWVNLRNREL
jgi:hypothetical protein